MQDIISVSKDILNESWNDNVIIACVGYVLMQPILRWIFKDGAYYESNKKFWKYTMAVYNFALSFYSLWTFYVAVTSLYQTGLWPQNPTSPSQGAGCQGTIFQNADFAMVSRYFYLSKYVEFLDTAFLIIAQKPVSFLQYFHHIGAAPVMWVLNRYQNDAIWVFVGFNSFIHTLMYFYYAMTALGIPIRSIKSIMTTLQILQLTVGTTVSFCYPFFLECFKQDLHKWVGYWFSAMYTISLAFLFAQFYIESYVKPSARSDKPKKN
eukprot:TRINITY_DN3843_c0_g1_i1.p1 TRINITY_DN3843_c0_g1~~TRINITY_DN3843_c0_g1_i1.p1  ORF type:complete len:265 (+),score=47.23 TRINITY_DN3843_c0_g1_i1:29-823(+)